MEKSSVRINFIDGIRGFTMLLVIYSHLCLSMFSHDDFYLLQLLNKIFITFRMPLFFFISGFFVYNKVYDLPLFKKRAGNRIIRQLYPTIVIGTIWCIAFYESQFIEMLLKPYKCGYWFTIVSVEMFFIGASLLYLFNIGDIHRKWQIIIFVAIGSLSYILSTVATELLFTPDSFWTLFSIYQLSSYLIFFFSGIVFRMFYDKFKLKLSYTPPLVSIFILLISMILYGWVNTIFADLFHLVTSFVGIMCVLCIFSNVYSKTKFSETKGAFLIEFFGRSTLEIYLLHYFFIEILGEIAPFNELMGNCCPRYLHFPIGITLSVIIASLCTGLVSLLKYIKIYTILFPENKHRISVHAPQ